MKLLIKNAKIITMNENLDIIDGSIIVENNIISEIVLGCINEKIHSNFDEIIEAEGKIVAPGFINTHSHLGMVGFRSLVDGIKNRLKTIFFPFEQNFMNRNLVYNSAKVGCIEMLQNGITTVVDMYYFEDEIAKAVEEVGIRGFLGPSVVNFNVCDMKGNEEDFELIEEFIKKYQNHNLIKPIIAPHSIYQNSIESLKKSFELANKYDTNWTMHLSEMDFEISELKEKHNLTPIGFLAKNNLLNERLIAAHCVIVTDEDIDLLKKYNVNVSHCPISNAKSGRLVAPIIKMLDKGVNVCLGTDGPSSLNALDLFEVIKMTGYIHKCVNRDTTAMSSVDLIKMATINAAKALNKENEIGSIEVGKKADMMILETDSPNMIPIFDVYSLLAYSACSKNIDTVIVDGKILVKSGKIQNHDMKKVKNDFNVSMIDFSKQANDELKKLGIIK